MSTADKLKSLENVIKDQNALNSPITQIEELQEKRSDLKDGKVCGFDAIRTEMLKHSSSKLKMAVLKLLNLVLKSGIYPEIWNKGLITPIFSKLFF